MITIFYFPTLIKNLRNAEHFFLFYNVSVLLEETVVKPASLQLVCNRFLAVFRHEDHIFKRPARREETARIYKANKKQKASYIALRQLLKAASYSETPAVKAAAVSLMNMMENYVAIRTAPMTEASALITNMLGDLSTERRVAQLALIAGAAEFVGRLQRDKDAFAAIYAERAFTKEELKEEGTMSNARKVVDREFAKLADAINSVYKTNELLQPKDPEVSATLSHIITCISSYIHEYEEIYARRTSGLRAPKDD